MNEKQLRKEAKKFADYMQPITSHDCQDELDYVDYQIEYLIAKLLGKDPYKCFCDEKYPIRRIENGTELCCECEKPIECAYVLQRTSITVRWGFNALTFQPDVKQLKSNNLVSWYAAPLLVVNTESCIFEPKTNV